MYLYRVMRVTKLMSSFDMLKTNSPRPSSSVSMLRLKSMILYYSKPYYWSVSGSPEHTVGAHVLNVHVMLFIEHMCFTVTMRLVVQAYFSIAYMEVITVFQ